MTPPRRPLLLAFMVPPLLAGAALCGGCGRAATAGPSVAQQTEQRIARARDLALAAQRAEKEDRVDDAINLYGQAVAEWREFPAAWTNLGRLLDKRGDAMQAARAYLAAADYAPQSPEPYYNLGVLWENRGYAEEAARYYDKALQRDQNYLAALRRSIYLDQAVLMRGDETTAERLRRALLLETDPGWIERFERYKLRLDASLSSAPAPLPAAR